jgi:hypothetical protein
MSFFKKTINKRQEGETGPVQGYASGRYKERVKEGKFGGNILYSCTKIEELSLLK